METYIHAKAIDDTHIVFKCPHHRRVTYHRHGSCGDLTNRITHRSSHCEHLGDYHLIIDDETIRGTIRNNRVLRRSLGPMDKLYCKQVEKLNK